MCGIGHFLVRGCGIDGQSRTKCAGSGIEKLDNWKNVRDREFLCGIDHFLVREECGVHPLWLLESQKHPTHYISVQARLIFGIPCGIILLLRTKRVICYQNGQASKANFYFPVVLIWATEAILRITNTNAEANVVLLSLCILFFFSKKETKKEWTKLSKLKCLLYVTLSDLIYGGPNFRRT